MWIVEPVSDLGSSTYPVLPLRAWVSSVQCKADKQLLMVIRESSKMEMESLPPPKGWTRGLVPVDVQQPSAVMAMSACIPVTSHFRFMFIGVPRRLSLVLTS